MSYHENIPYEDDSRPCFTYGDFRYDWSVPRDRPLTMSHRMTSDLKDKLGLSYSADRRLVIAIESMLADAIDADQIGLAVSVSLNRNYYAGLSRYHDAMRYPTIQRALTAIEGLGLVTVEKGLTWAEGGRGKQTRFWPTERLREIIGDEPALVSSPPQELIVLKDADKNRIDYRDTDRTDRWRRELLEMNDAIASVDIRVTAKDVEWKNGRVSIPDALKRRGGELAPLVLRPDSIVFNRSFNNSSWEQGGRHYGHWIQRLNKRRRSQVTINGADVALLDYKASHIGILYSWSADPFDRDPYDIEGFERDAIKLGLLIAINAETPKKALRALAYEFMESDKQCENKIYPRRSHFDEAKRVLEAIKKRHKPIADWFCSGVGVRLQFEEAEVLRRAMAHARKQGIVCLPVHDELVVAKGKSSSNVEDLMVRCWGERFGTFPIVSQ